jgi:hypothetical protein
MLSVRWRVGALAVGATIAMAGAARAGDDVMTLKLNPASVAVGSMSDFVPADRAMPGDDDLTDVNLRYRLGYARGASGGVYILPRFYAFRAGFSDGLYGNTFAGYGWGARWGYWGPRRAYGGPRWAGFWGAGRGGYYYPSYGYGGSYGPYGSGPVYAGSSLCCDSSASYYSADQYGYAPSGASYGNAYGRPMATGEPSMQSSAPQLMPMPTPKLGTEPAPKSGPQPITPPTPKAKYRYNGGPANPVPQPIGRPNSTEGRLVSAPAAKKYSYAAYGENRQSKSDPDAALLVKHD